MPVPLILSLIIVGLSKRYKVPNQKQFCDSTNVCLKSVRICFDENIPEFRPGDRQRLVHVLDGRSEEYLSQLTSPEHYTIW